MARPLRIEYPGAVYHVTSRGNARNKIFEDDGDREVFLEVLGSVIKRFNWLCHAYCLMDNHYHLLIETPDANLSKGVRQLNGVYTQRYNRRHDKVGHIFQGRYKAILVEKESYLLELCRYVLLNPVRAGVVKRPEQWGWSSYASTTGIKKTPEYLTVGWILGQFGNRKKEAQDKYIEFVMAEYKESIDILGEAGIIPDEFAFEFSPVAGFRNILVHEYAKIDLTEVHRHLQKDLADFEKFAKYIIEYLKKTA